MAQILIFRESPGPLKPLRKSLQGHHELYFVSVLNEAMDLLRSKHIDLIICRVHMRNTNAFEFLKKVKADAAFRAIPFIFLSSEQTDVSTYLDENLEHAAIMCGADSYLILDRFCRNGACDYDGLRTAIEDVLVQHKQHAWNDYPKRISPIRHRLDGQR